MSRRSQLVLLLLIVAAGAGLRIWGLRFGLPNTIAHPDERAVAGVSVKFLRGDLNPRFFHYPTFFMYVLGGLYATYCGGSIAAGGMPSLAACADSWPHEWAPFFLIARGLSAFAGTVSITLVYALGRRLGRDEEQRRFAGLASAALVAVAFLHVRDSHFGVTDVAMAAMVLAALVLLLRAHENPSPRAFLLAGAVGGLAASTKYNAVLLAAPVLVSQGFEAYDAWRLGRSSDWRALVYGAAAAVAFLLGTPYSVLDYHRFYPDMLFDIDHLRHGHGVFLGIGWKHHFVFSLWYGVGWPLLAAGIAGTIWIAVRSPRMGALVFAFPIVYYIAAGRGYTVFVRHMIPVVPFLCLAAGGLAAMIRASVGQRFGPRTGMAAALALLAVCLLPNAVKSVEIDRLLSRMDSRVVAARWIDPRMQPDSTIYVSGGFFGSPDLWRRGAPPPYAIWRWNDHEKRFETPSGLTEHWPDWIVTQTSPIRLYAADPPPEVQAGLSNYQLARSIQATTAGPEVYDQQDAWFLPMADLRKVTRPGPNLYIYHRARR